MNSVLIDEAKLRFPKSGIKKINAEKSADKTDQLTLIEDLKKNHELYILMIPYFLLFILMVALPVLAAIGLSLTYYNMFEFPQFRGLTNYVNLFLNDDVFYIALKNTMIFALITGPLGYLLCFFIAWLINEFPRKLRVFLTFVFYVPTLSGSAFFIWQFLFSGDAYGLINGLLMHLGAIKEPIQWLSDPAYDFKILILVQLWMSLGTGFLAFIAGFQSVDRSLYEAGDIDGISNRFQELAYITLPIMKPQLFFGAIMQISASFSVGAISQQLCGFPSTDYSAHTLVLHMMDYGTIRYEMGYACAIAVVLFVLLLIFKQGVNMLLRYIGDE